MNKYINDFNIAKNFNLSEFVSPDTGTVKINCKLVSKLQELRGNLISPITINSGYRTVEHNKKVGGKKHSSHLRGNAVDIWSRKHTIEYLFWFAIILGFDRIIAYDHKKFLHLDVDGKKYIQVPKSWQVKQQGIPKCYKLKQV